MDIKAIAQRIKGLREDLEISVERMCELCELSEEEYNALENGEVDFTFSFLNRCATIFGIDIAELLRCPDIIAIGYQGLHAFRYSHP